MEEIEKLIEQLELSGFDLEGEVKFPVFGESILLTIALSGEGEVQASQKDTLDWFYQSIESLYPSIEKAIFEYYKSVMPEYHLGLGELSNELMPPISSQEKVWKYVSEPGIFIFPEDEGGNLHLEFECSFDVEHGFRVVFENRQLKYVGID
jgi:hypothetical protein